MNESTNPTTPRPGVLVGYKVTFGQDLRPGDRFILVEQAQQQVLTQRLEVWEPDPDDVPVFELVVSSPGQAEMRGRHRGRGRHFRPLP